MSGAVAAVTELALAGGLAAQALKLAEAQSQKTGIGPGVYETIVILLFSFIGLAVFAVCLWLLMRRSLGYIGNITDAVSRISEGDLSTHLEIEDDNEFSEIAMKLNSMMDDVQVLIEKEHEAERSKNELITNIAHDLRTPLTSIIGYLELLSMKTDIPAETRKEYLNVAYTKSRKLQQLIEDLFGLTKLNYGKIAMKVSRVDIVKLLSQVMDEFYPNFQSAGLAFGLTSDVSSFMINADGNLLARLFDNLINNAIKYGSDGKRIDVRIETGPEEAVVSVINYGKVIPAEEIPYLFDKFYRVEQSRSVKTGGTGLGLAIAKNIVDMHQGSITAESDLHGTRFIVRLKPDLDINRENFDQ